MPEILLILPAATDPVAKFVGECKDCAYLGA